MTKRLGTRAEVETELIAATAAYKTAKTTYKEMTDLNDVGFGGL